MTQIRNNPIMTGARGMLGNVVYYRQFRGKTLMCNRPEKRKRPEIDEVDLTGYHGNENDVIVVKASDIIKTLIVAISIFGADGKLVEQGDAVSNAFEESYLFRTRQKNSRVRGSKALVTVS